MARTSFAEIPNVLSFSSNLVGHLDHGPKTFGCDTIVDGVHIDPEAHGVTEYIHGAAKQLS